MRFAWLCSLTLIACNPVYAPPIRSVQYGAPARLTEGRVEIDGTAGGFVVPNVGGPNLAIGIRDWVAIEAGGNLALAGTGKDSWAMGYLGPRFSFAPNRKAPVHLIGDLEFGAGVGIGGRNDVDNGPNRPSGDGLSWSDRIAWGGYEGLGLGAQIHWFSIYARVRLEESVATNVPLTLWPSASLGLEANIHQRAAITVAGGYLGYTNGKDTEHGAFWQIGVAVFLDAFPRHDAHTVEPTPPRPQVPPEEWDEPKKEEEPKSEEED